MDTDKLWRIFWSTTTHHTGWLVVQAPDAATAADRARAWLARDPGAWEYRPRDLTADRVDWEDIEEVPGGVYVEEHDD